MKIACLMMQKDEGKLLDLWITYHSHLVGSTNLYIFDNHSSDPFTLELLKNAQKNGSTVKYGSVFRNKGDIICRTIKDLVRSRKYDFYFPVDCDELLALLIENYVVLDTNTINSSIRFFINTKNTLIIRKYIYNNPLKPDHYNKENAQKTFFPRIGCTVLDLGFHGGRTVNRQKTETNLCYIHFHYRPYSQYIERCKQKMKGRLKDFEPETINNFRNTKHPAGVHMLSRLLQNEEEYNKSFTDYGIHIPQIADYIKQISNNRITLNDLWT